MSKSKKKRVNPRRLPMTPEQALRYGQDRGLDTAMAILFYALVDGGHIQPAQLKEVWDSVNYLSDSIVKGYVNVSDLKRVLDTEYGIKI